MYVCWYGLRLSDLNKETTYLLTYLHCLQSQYALCRTILSFIFVYLLRHMGSTYKNKHKDKHKLRKQWKTAYKYYY